MQLTDETIVVLKKAKKAGQCLSLERDLTAAPEGTHGLTLKAVKARVHTWCVFRHDKEAGTPLLAEDLKKAVIGAIIACRMKSSRLPGKALLKIGNLTSAELCMKNALKIQNIHKVVMATSTVEQDAVLKDYTYHPDVILYRGNPDDLIDRHYQAATDLGIDVILRLTADCPYISNATTQEVLAAHFEVGADYSAAEDAAVGTNAEIINRSSFAYLKELFPRTLLSEYLTYYFTNNPTHFHIHKIQLPATLVRDYRLTLDYQQDLDFFRVIEQHLQATKNGHYDLYDIFAFLDAHPEVVAINYDMGLVYKHNPDLVARITAESTLPTLS